MGPAPVADAGHDGLVVEDLARIDERRVAGTVSGELCPADAEPRGDARQVVAGLHDVRARPAVGGGVAVVADHVARVHAVRVTGRDGHVPPVAPELADGLSALDGHAGAAAAARTTGVRRRGGSARIAGGCDVHGAAVGLRRVPAGVGGPCGRVPVERVRVQRADAATVRGAGVLPDRGERPLARAPRRRPGLADGLGRVPVRVGCEPQAVVGGDHRTPVVRRHDGSRHVDERLDAPHLMHAVQPALRPPRPAVVGPARLPAQDRQHVLRTVADRLAQEPVGLGLRRIAEVGAGEMVGARVHARVDGRLDVAVTDRIRVPVALRDLRDQEVRAVRLQRGRVHAPLPVAHVHARIRQSGRGRDAEQQGDDDREDPRYQARLALVLDVQFLSLLLMDMEKPHPIGWGEISDWLAVTSGRRRRARTSTRRLRRLSSR